MSTRARLAAVAVAVLVLPAAAACQEVEDLFDAAPDSSEVSEGFDELVPFTVEVDGAALIAAIEALPVADEVDEGYDRSLFPHWRDADGNGCNARDDTLIAEDRSGKKEEKRKWKGEKN